MTASLELSMELFGACKENGIEGPKCETYIGWRQSGNQRGNTLPTTDELLAWMPDTIAAGVLNVNHGGYMAVLFSDVGINILHREYKSSPADALCSLSIWLVRNRPELFKVANGSGNAKL
jgi:hypothetical protein